MTVVNLQPASLSSSTWTGLYLHRSLHRHQHQVGQVDLEVGPPYNSRWIDHVLHPHVEFLIAGAQRLTLILVGGHWVASKKLLSIALYPMVRVLNLGD